MPTTFANTSYKRQWKQKDSDNQMQMSDEVEQNWNRNWIQPLATQQEQHGKLFAVRVFFYAARHFPASLWRPENGGGKKDLFCLRFEIFNCLVLRLDATRIKNIYPQTRISEKKTGVGGKGLLRRSSVLLPLSTIFIFKHI